jgi:hypothetical protein
MSKSERSQGARRKTAPAAGAGVPDAVEGQITEICRDLAVQIKRMRELQEQADELRVVLRDWASPSPPAPPRARANRAGRR